MQFSDVILMSSSPILTNTMPSESTKILAALVTAIVSASLVASIFLLEDRKSVWGFVLDKNLPEESAAPADAPAHEQELAEVPMEETNTSVLQRMCQYGCCPFNEPLVSYYDKFTTPALNDRASYITEQLEFAAENYTAAKMEYTLAKEKFSLATDAFSHLMKTSEKLNELCESRTMHEKLKGHTLDEMYMMLAAVHQWKAFQYAPDGIYPYQKELWEKAILKEIYTYNVSRT
jgi:hypothetical protein